MNCSATCTALSATQEASQKMTLHRLKKPLMHTLPLCAKNFLTNFHQNCIFLECHLTRWMKRFPFGMGLLGEQGGESCHREFKRLNRVMQAIPDPLRRLTAIMKEHVLSTHPKIIRHTILPKKRKLHSSQQCHIITGNSAVILLMLFI